MELEYLTKDLYFAAYLVAKGTKLLEVKPDPSTNNKWFAFGNPLGCKKEEKKYWNYQGSLIAKEYVDAIRKVKERLYADV